MFSLGKTSPGGGKNKEKRKTPGKIRKTAVKIRKTGRNQWNSFKNPVKIMKPGTGTVYDNKPSEI